MVEWENIQYKTQNVTAVISILLNLFLVFLILTKSPKNLGAYKHLMVFISIFEIFYSLVDAMVTPIFYSYGCSNVIYVNLRKSIFSSGIAEILIAVYVGCFGCSLAVFGIHFIYRYFVVSGKKHFKYFENWKVVIWMIVPIIYGIVWGTTAYYLCGPDEKTDNYLKNGLLKSYDIRIDQISYLGLFFYPKNQYGRTYLAEKPLISMFIFMLEISSSVFVIIHFGTKCYIKINKLLESSRTPSRNTRLQSQLFYALVTQAMIPVILMHIPATIVFVLAISGQELGTASGIMSITIALYPAFDPLPTIFIIKSYRKTVFGKNI